MTLRPLSTGVVGDPLRPRGPDQGGTLGSYARRPLRPRRPGQGGTLGSRAPSSSVVGRSVLRADGALGPVGTRLTTLLYVSRPPRRPESR